MYRYRNILAIIVLSAVILVISSCAPAEEGGFLRALDSPAEMKITGERNGVAFEAELTIGEKKSDGSRDGEMIFTSPESLAGISVSTAGGVWNSSLDGIAIAGISAELIGAPLAVFSQMGNALSAEKITDDEGRALTLIVIDGSDCRLEYRIDSKSGAPVSVTEKSAYGTVIMKFDIKEYKVIP